MENILAPDPDLMRLKAQLLALEGPQGRARPARSAVEGPASEQVEPQALHDLYAATPADAVSVNAFGLGLALKAAAGRPVVWGLHEMMAQEAGRPHGPGLHEMGLSPRDLLLVRACDVQTLLAVGEEALRSPAVGAVLLSAWGEARAFSLTASRRLALAAKSGTATLFLARAGAVPCPSAARTRWSVAAAASIPLAGETPGQPSFSATLLRRRGGGATGTWVMEWDREQRSFRPPAPLSGGLAAVAGQRPAAASGGGPQGVRPGAGPGTGPDRGRRAA